MNWTINGVVPKALRDDLSEYPGSGSALRIWAAIDTRMHPKGVVLDLGCSDLAQMCGFTEKTVIKHAKGLSDRGWLTVIHHHDDASPCEWRLKGRHPKPAEAMRYVRS